MRPIDNIKNLDQLNAVLNETMSRGVNNAVQAKWGGRDVTLTFEDGTQITVKMKDLASKFKELANKKGANKDKINDIAKNIIKLDFIGDVKLEQFGKWSKTVRDIKNIFTSSHLDVVDSTSKKQLSKDIQVQERATLIKDKYDELKDNKINVQEFVSFVDKNFDETTKFAVRLLSTSDPEFSFYFSFHSQSSKNPEVREFAESFREEGNIRSTRSATIKSEIKDIDRTNKRVEFLIQNYEKNPEAFVENYFNYGFREGGGFNFDYKKDLEALMNTDPAKAYPIIRALATRTIPENANIKVNKEEEANATIHLAATRKQREEVKTLCQDLMKQCEKRILERLNKFSPNYSIDINRGGAWSVHFIPLESLLPEKELLKVLDVSKDLLIPIIFNRAWENQTDNLKDAQYWQQVTGATDIAAKNAVKDAIIKGKKIIAKAIESEITDKELQALLSENSIDLKSVYFRTNKNDPKDNLDLINLMVKHRPALLGPKIVKDIQNKQLKAKLSELYEEFKIAYVNLPEKSMLQDEKMKKLMINRDLANLRKALSAYGAGDLSSTITDIRTGTQIPAGEIFQKVILSDSNIRKGIEELKTGTKKEQKLATVLEQVIASLGTMPDLKNQR